MGSKNTLCHGIARSAPQTRTLSCCYACTMSACHAAVARLTASHLLCLPGVSLTVHICERP